MMRRRVPKPDMKQVLAAAAKDLRDMQAGRQGEARPAPAQRSAAGSKATLAVPQRGSEDDAAGDADEA
jgi:hypothetical protein